MKKQPKEVVSKCEILKITSIHEKGALNKMETIREEYQGRLLQAELMQDYLPRVLMKDYDCRGFRADSSYDDDVLCLTQIMGKNW